MASSVGIFRWEACEEASVAAGVELGWASGWGVAAGLWVLGVAAGCGCGHVAARHHGAHHTHPLGRRRSRCRRRGRGGVLRHRRGGRGRAGGAGVLRAPARRRRPCRRCRTALLLAKAPATGSASCEHTRESCGSGVACAHCAGVAEVSRALSRLPSTDVLAVLAIAPKGLAEGRGEERTGLLAANGSTSKSHFTKVRCLYKRVTRKILRVAHQSPETIGGREGGK